MISRTRDPDKAANNAWLGTVLATALAVGACTFNPPPRGAGGGGNSGAGRGGSGTGQGGAHPCVDLECRQSTCTRGNCMVRCPAGTRTTVSGTIYDPAGKIPLYNISVYVPNAPLADIADGPSCDPCDSATGTSLLSGSPISITKTDVAGRFTLGMMGGDVPAGDGVPLVIQVGKWRRQVMLGAVAACQDNPLADADHNLRLPRNKAEGHIPKMALTTGSLDALECLLRKIGIDELEFTPETADGRVNFYAGGGGTSSYDARLNAGAPITAVHPWWDSLDNLRKYDIILHSCEGGQGDYRNGPPMSAKSMAARQALQDFADMGGRVFASHWHSYWFQSGPPAFQRIATWTIANGLPNPNTAFIDAGRTALTRRCTWPRTRPCPPPTRTREAPAGRLS